MLKTNFLPTHTVESFLKLSCQNKFFLLEFKNSLFVTKPSRGQVFHLNSMSTLIEGIIEEACRVSNQTHTDLNWGIYFLHTG